MPATAAAAAEETPTKKNGVRVSFIDIARRLGFLDPAQDAQAAELLETEETDPELSSQDILLDAGVLTEDQVKEVEHHRRSEDAKGHLDDKFRQARNAITGSHTSAARLVDLMAKKV